MKKKIIYGIALALLIFALITNIIIIKQFIQTLQVYIIYTPYEGIGPTVTRIIITAISIIAIIFATTIIARELVLEFLPTLKAKIAKKKEQNRVLKIEESEQKKKARIEKLERELAELKNEDDKPLQ